MVAAFTLPVSINNGNNDSAITFIKGDVNGDGETSIGDVTALIDLLLSGNTGDHPAADVNEDNEVSIGDVTALIDMLLSK